MSDWEWKLCLHESTEDGIRIIPIGPRLLVKDRSLIGVRACVIHEDRRSQPPWNHGAPRKWPRRMGTPSISPQVPGTVASAATGRPRCYRAGSARACEIHLQSSEKTSHAAPSLCREVRRSFWVLTARVRSCIIGRLTNEVIESLPAKHCEDAQAQIPELLT